MGTQETSGQRSSQGSGQERVWVYARSGPGMTARQRSVVALVRRLCEDQLRMECVLVTDEPGAATT